MGAETKIGMSECPENDNPRVSAGWWRRSPLFRQAPLHARGATGLVASYGVAAPAIAFSTVSAGFASAAKGLAHIAGTYHRNSHDLAPLNADNSPTLCP